MITISQIKIGQVVQIGRHPFEYKGQRTEKKKGIKTSVYWFYGTMTEEIKSFNVTSPPTFTILGGGIYKMN